MVAQERHVTQDDRLLVVRVDDLIDILLILASLLDTLLPLSLEWREHLSEEGLGIDV